MSTRIKYRPFSVHLATWTLLLLLSACTPWTDPTEPLPTLSPDQLDELAQVDQHLPLIEGKKVDEQLDSLLRWTALLKIHDEQAALTYAREAVKIATEHNRRADQAIGLYYLSLIEARTQVFAEGMASPMANGQLSYKYWQTTDNAKWRALTGYLMGDLFYREENMDSSFYFYSSALRSIDKDPEPSPEHLLIRGSLLHGLGNLQRDYKGYAFADSVYQLAQVVYQANHDTIAMARLKQDIAWMYWKNNDEKKCLDHLSESIFLSQAKEDRQTLADCYQQLGNVFRSKYRSSSNLNDFDQGLEWFRKSLEIQKNNFYYTNNRIGKLMQDRANRDNRPEYVDSALVYYGVALEQARQEGALDYFRALSKNIAILCEWRAQKFGKNCENVLGTSASNYLFTNYSGVVDTITLDLAAALENQDALQRQQQNFNNQQRIQRTWLISGIGLLLGGFIFVFLFQKQKQRRLEARMEALRAQINPHFFSNSLNAIESLVNLDQRKAASKYLIHFSRLTRRVLNSSMAPTTSLAGELETTKHFLALEQLRFKDKLQYEIDLADDIDPASVEVPALLLQPFLENAIWHGIKPKTSPGMLQVAVQRDGNELLLSVEDNGIGRAAAQELKDKSQLNEHGERKSVGLKITRERLRRSGGGKLAIEDLYDENGQAAGTRVLIRLPYKNYTP